MKASLMLAEYATAHPDGTVSVLRGGISHVWGEGGPVALEGRFVVRIVHDPGDMGPHQFDLRCLDEDGGPVLPPLSGHFETPRGGGLTNFILGFGVNFPKLGRYEFVLRVDNVQLDTWVVTAAKKSSANPGQGASGADKGQGR